MFVSQKKYDSLKKENDELFQAHCQLLKDYNEAVNENIRISRELNELKKKNEPSYFG